MTDADPPVTKIILTDLAVAERMADQAEAQGHKVEVRLPIEGQRTSTRLKQEKRDGQT